MKIAVSFFCFTAFFLASSSALALDYSADLALASQYESNAALGSSSNQNSQEDIGSTAALNIRAGQQTQRLSFDAGYNIAYTDYDKDSNEDRSEITGNSNLQVTLVNQRLLWNASHSSSETVADRNLENTADNRQRRQQFSTGPLLIVPLSKVDQLSLQANYSIVEFNDAENDDLNNDPNTDADSQSYFASLNWSRRLSPLTSINAGYRYQENERDNAGANSEDLTIDIQTYFVGLTRSLRALEYGIQIGGNRSERDDDLGNSSNSSNNSSSNNGFFFQAQASYTSGDQTIGATASRQQTDSSTGLGNFFSGISSSASSSPSTDLSLENFRIADTVETTILNLSYSASRFCNRCNYGLSYNFIENDYQNELSLSDRDDRVSQINLNYSYRINRRLSLDIAGRYEHTEFLGTGAEDEETGGTLGLRWQAMRKLDISITGGYEQRDGGDNPNYYNSYGSLRLTYNLFSSN